jgi:pyruvate dehydrogenase E1 component alpha subunit
MPREKIDLEYAIDYLSILHKNGEVDSDLEPDIDEDLLRKLHRAMLLGRRFDERMLKLQRSGKIGTFAPIQGQEAAQLGAVACLTEADWFVPSFRETAAEVWRGKPMENVLLAYAGFNEGAAVPEGDNTLPVAVPVGTQTLHAAGIGYGMKLKGKEEVAMVFFGDGATSEGDFHEAMNFAAVFKTPTVFICQNNHWAISIKRSHQTRSQTLAQKALAYGMPGIQVDGNDILAVYAGVKEAVDRARSGDGPTLVECVTYRMSVHTTADDPKRYRTEEEVKEWEEKDPIDRFQKYLKGKDLLSDDDIGTLESEIKDEIKDAVKRWEKRMSELTDPRVMFDFMYAEMPPYLAEQKEAFEKTLSDKEK